MTYALYADDEYIDDIASARGLLDMQAALTAHEPTHPLTKFINTFTLDLPTTPSEVVDQFIALKRLDLHVGEPTDSVIDRLIHGLDKAYAKSPTKVVISDGLGDGTLKDPPPPIEQRVEPPTPPEPTQN